MDHDILGYTGPVLTQFPEFGVKMPVPLVLNRLLLQSIQTEGSEIEPVDGAFLVLLAMFDPRVHSNDRVVFLRLWPVSESKYFFHILAVHRATKPDDSLNRRRGLGLGVFFLLEYQSIASMEGID